MKMRVGALANFIEERWRILQRREAREKKPWTKDKILQRYRFCNVRREDDTVTKWIAENWRGPHKSDPDLWFAMAVARKINWPDTLQEIGYPVPWNREDFIQLMKARAGQGKQLESGAYMITAGTGPEWIGVPKYIFLGKVVFQTLWEKREFVRPTKEDTLRSFHSRLQSAGPTVGSFIAGQVVADLKYVRPLSRAKDWYSWAAPGPGSERGLNRVCGFPVKDRWEEDCWLNHLQQLQARIMEELDKRKSGVPYLHAQDLQNCLCEFDKYERVRLGEGRPRSLYDGV